MRTLVLVSKNRNVTHFKIRSRQPMTPSFSLSKCLKQNNTETPQIRLYKNLISIRQLTLKFYYSPKKKMIDF